MESTCVSFGTDGIRGPADQFPFDALGLLCLGKALGLWMIKKYDRRRPCVVIGCDTRESCDFIKNKLIHMLNIYSIRVVDAGIIPTPALCSLIYHDERYDSGIMISASHNAYQDNGIKIFDAKTGKLTESDERLLESYFSFFYEHMKNACEHCLLVDDEKVMVEILNQSGIDHYLAVLSTFFPPLFLSGIIVVLDCAHGANYRYAPAVFKFFGARVISISVEPNGKNINDQCGALHPDVLQKCVVTEGAHIGFAFDGDGDRVIAVNSKGEVRDGDDLLFLLKKLPPFEGESSVVGTVMTNSGLEHELVRKGFSLIRAKVGDKYVAAAMLANNVRLGGESSGHIIMSDYLPTGDGIFAALRVAQAALMSYDWDLTTCDKFPQVMINLPVDYKNDLNGAPYDHIIDQGKRALGVGRLLIRYSGTENVLRIMTEAANIDIAQSVAADIAHQLSSLFTIENKGV